MLGLVGLRWFSYRLFSPLIVNNAVSYGPLAPSWSYRPRSSGSVSWCSAVPCWAAISIKPAAQP